jgi:NADPH:quinone reductase-like Zn-dependent oxidoreductase
MEAIRIHQFGTPDVLRDEEIERPEPGQGELLVQVKAASVNPVDTKMRSGSYPTPREEDLPVILGRDLSGTIDKLGRGVKGFKTGDAVFVALGEGRGAYAQYVLVKPEEAAPKPKSLSDVEAAAVPLAALTAWQGLFDHGHLQTGQRVLIHGGAGGVGHFAIQFARHAGADVVTTASDEDRPFLIELGAGQIIDHTRDRFENIVSPVDLVFDLVGGDTLERSYALVKPGGRLVTTVGKPSPQRAEARHIEALHYLVEPNSKELAEIGMLIDQGEIRPHVAAIFTLATVAQAHERLEHGHVQGKIVLNAA